MQLKKLFKYLFLNFPLIISIVSCNALNKVERKQILPDSLQKLNSTQIAELNKASPYLKAHMENGNIYVLQDWNTDDEHKLITGNGILFNAKRDTLDKRTFEIAIDSVAIFETNEISMSGSAIALTVFTGITAAITTFCIINPKTCFGSCPTFYINNGDSLRLQAEGFSSSIAPSMEATDIDALYNAKLRCDEFIVEMRNEAMETHVVRSVNLLAIPRTNGSRVFADSEGKLWECASITEPISAIAPEGNIYEQISDADNKEWYSKADSTFLGTKETIDLEFENILQQQYGLVIGCRQTLLSTYLLYQTYAYMGNNAGYWFAEIERNKLRAEGNAILNLLGGLEILLQDSTGNWVVVGTVDEYGPLAIDYHLIKLGILPKEKTNIRLRMTRGYWRIDYIALAALFNPVQAIRLQPIEVTKDGKPDEQAKKILCDSTKTLITLPGDTYILKYQMPSGFTDYELFLESRGYYLEWIRKEWIKEENPLLLVEMFMNPTVSLKRLAPEFKKVEPKMEYYFWRSRYAKP